MKYFTKTAKRNILLKNPEASSQKIPVTINEPASSGRKEAENIVKAIKRGRKYNSSELIEKTRNTQNIWERYGYLWELHNRKVLEKHPNLQQEYTKFQKSFLKDFRKYLKVKGPEDALTKPALIGTGLGLGGIMGPGKAFQTTEKKTESFLKGIAKRRNIDIANTSKSPDPTALKELFKEMQKAKTQKGLRLDVSKDYGKFWDMISGKTPGPHYSSGKFFGQEVGKPYIATTPNIGIAAHEMGHAINQKEFLKNYPKLKELYNASYLDVSNIPVLGRFGRVLKHMPLLGVPAGLGAIAIAKQQAKGKDIPWLPEKLEEHPSGLVAPFVLPKLFEEGSATTRGLKEIATHFNPQGKAKAVKEVGKALAALGPAYGSYAVGASIPFLALKAYKNQLKEKKKLEQKYKVE